VVVVVAEGMLLFCKNAVASKMCCFAWEYAIVVECYMCNVDVLKVKNVQLGCIAIEKLPKC